MAIPSLLFLSSSLSAAHHQQRPGHIWLKVAKLKPHCTSGYVANVGLKPGVKDYCATNFHTWMGTHLQNRQPNDYVWGAPLELGPAAGHLGAARNLI